MNFSFGERQTIGNRDEYTIKDYLTYGGITLLIFMFITLYAFELEYFNPYTNVSLFLKAALVFGLSIGVSLAFYLKRQAKNATEILQIFTFCIVVCLIFSPLVCSLTNRAIATDTYKKEVQIIQIDKRYVSRFGKSKNEKIIANRLVVKYLYKGKSYFFSTKDMTLAGLKRGDEVFLDFKKGLWGFEYSLP